MRVNDDFHGASYTVKLWIREEKEKIFNWSKRKILVIEYLLLFSHWDGVQVLNGNPYNRKCDVYSFGICLWEIYCCDMPYPDLSFSEITSAVVRQVYFLVCFDWFPYLSSDCLSLFCVHGSIMIILLCSVGILEFKTRNTKMLPKFSGKCHEEMLGCHSR